MAAVLALLVCVPGPLFAQDGSPSAEADRPNVIYILLDDTGFSDLGAYGSEISTPHIDDLARDGLRYNHFESRAICSPTRAALLTGRNSQSVGMMDLAGGPDDAPAHSRGEITPEAATIATILKRHGYRTTVTGKWHLTPEEEFYDSAAGSAPTYENWPTGKGFDNFYGWLYGWTDQYDPEGPGRRMIEGKAPANESNPGGEHVSEEIVSRAIGAPQIQPRPAVNALAGGVLGLLDVADRQTGQLLRLRQVRRDHAGQRGGANRLRSLHGSVRRFPRAHGCADRSAGRLP